jgi:hypothetical protein
MLALDWHAGKKRKLLNVLFSYIKLHSAVNKGREPFNKFL